MNKVDKHFDVAQEVLNLTEKEYKKLTPVNILVIGKSGVGKSTLINSVFRQKIADTGIGKPVTKHLQKISRKDVPITIYDTRGLELTPEVQTQVKNEIKTLINNKKNSKEKIHVAYYCIQATSSRIEESEIKIIEEISKKIPVVLVLTQTIGEESQDFEIYLKDLNLPVVGVYPVLAKPYVISEEYTIEAFGLEKLIDRTFDLIPENVKRSFINAQQVDIEKKVESARSWAKKYTATSFGVGFTPIPFSDASVLVPMQVTLLAHITVIFGVSIDKTTILSMIAAVGGTSSATVLGRTIVANAFKFIPGVGTIVGGMISGTTASIVTYGLANSYIQALKIVAANEFIDEDTSIDKVINIMQQQFDKFMKNHKKELKKESSSLKIDLKSPFSNVKVIKRTINKFIDKIGRNSSE